MKLFFDFFPIILFFAAFKLKGIFVATTVAIAASIVQIGWVYYSKKKVEPMLWISLALVVVLGGATLFLRNETFIKWKPTVLYCVMGAALVGGKIFFKKNAIQALLKSQMNLPDPVWNKLNLAWGLFFFFLAAANLAAALTLSTSAWVNFKLFGILGLMLVFVLAQGLFLSKYLKVEKTPGQQ